MNGRRLILGAVTTVTTLLSLTSFAHAEREGLMLHGGLGFGYMLEEFGAVLNSDASPGTTIELNLGKAWDNGLALTAGVHRDRTEISPFIFEAGINDEPLTADFISNSFDVSFWLFMRLDKKRIWEFYFRAGIGVGNMRLDANEPVGYVPVTVTGFGALWFFKAHGALSVDLNIRQYISDNTLDFDDAPDGNAFISLPSFASLGLGFHWR